MVNCLFERRWIRILTLHLMLNYYTLVRGKLGRLNVGYNYPIKFKKLNENLTSPHDDPGNKSLYIP